MPTKPLDELYFVWLYSQVGDLEARNPSRTYWKVLKQLFTKEFIWIVPNDDNRIEDGKGLRLEFADQSGLKVIDRDWMKFGCSMLELLVGLSRRLSFQCDGEPRDWFWHMMDNLELNYNDRSVYPADTIDGILERVIWRTYEPDGQGGIFPLKHSERDQTKVEIWHQLFAYISELN